MQSRLKSRKACALCHERKIKCDGSNPCRNCLRAQVTCRPHERRRRITDVRPVDDERYSEVTARLAWLEGEIHRVFKVDIRQVRTGVPLDSLLRGDRDGYGDDISTGGANATPSQTPHYHHPPGSLHEDRFDRVHEVDPDISLLALNATGEVRYLGASSGSFFAKYIANVARSFSSSTSGLGFSSETRDVPLSSRVERLASGTPPADWRISETFPFLLRCYQRWIHSIYPLFPPSYFSMLESMSSSNNVPQENSDTVVIFYLVLSLGAIHSEQPHLLKELRGDPGLPAYQNASAQGLSAETLYWTAVNELESQIKSLEPRMSLVQILNLISIYASHRPSDNKQWHVGGIAMRLAIELGLHRHNDNWKFTPDELELRRMVFWTTYALEITLAFNLGRPASISFEDADAPFPNETSDTVMPIHHIRHRQIQEQMLSQVYRGRKNNPVTGLESCQSILDGLQDQLDQWHQDLHVLYRQSKSPYPVEYWDRLYYSTSAALSRPTPLIPRPGPQLHERCFLSSGSVIEIHYQLIREFSLPNSWMLLQGLILSAVSMIVTARTNTRLLSQRIGGEQLLDKMTKWIRKVSVVMAVMRERWVAFATNDLEDLLDKISRDTVQRIVSTMRNEPPGSQAPDGPGRHAIQSELQPLSGTRQGETESSSQPETLLPHAQYDMLPGSGDLMDLTAQQQTLNTPDTLNTVFPEWDSNAIWDSFDNLFETSELQTLFGVFSGQQYI